MTFELLADDDSRLPPSFVDTVSAKAVGFTGFSRVSPICSAHVVADDVLGAVVVGDFRRPSGGNLPPRMGATVTEPG